MSICTDMNFQVWKSEPPAVTCAIKTDIHLNLQRISKTCGSLASFFGAFLPLFDSVGRWQRRGGFDIEPHSYDT